MGYQEKKHFAIAVVLDDLNKKGRLEYSYVDDFHAAMSSREDADYHYIHSKDIAEYGPDLAGEFTSRMKELIGQN